jgi:hypothetical protein
MESFLDRLLADHEGARRQPPGTATETLATGTTATVEQAAPTGGLPLRRASAIPDPPSGSAAPRIAIYDTLTSPPRVVSVEEEDVPALIGSLAEKTYHFCRQQGGQVPYSVINELMENLLHACFRDVVITILDDGHTIRISDHGPGVDDKDRAFQPGFTTATADQRLIIRGVGSGLPLARESLQLLRGVLTVEDNLGGGAVFTIKMPGTEPPPEPASEAPRIKMTNRQTKVLVLLMELGEAGPTAVARELGISSATAYRELVELQNMGLIHSRGDGKRALTEAGVSLLESIL